MFYNKKKPLCNETDTSGFGYGPGLLQVRKSMNCLTDETPDNTTYQLMAFDSKACPVLNIL